LEDKEDTVAEDADTKISLRDKLDADVEEERDSSSAETVPTRGVWRKKKTIIDELNSLCLLGL